MSAASLDRLLAVLVAALALSGGASLTAGSPQAAWVFVVHDWLAGTLAIAVAAKLARSLPKAVRGRRWARLAVATVVSVAALGSLAAGYTWVAGGTLSWVDLGGARWTLLTLHAYLGIALLALLVVHLVPRRWRLLRSAPRSAVPAAPQVLSRRSILVGAGLAAGGLALAAAAGAIDAVMGGTRRFTGSRWLAAGPPGVPTTFLGEPSPAIDAQAWRLEIAGRVDRPAAFDLAGLQALGGTDATATLDCTAGWAITSTWRGLPLADLLAGAGAALDATRVDVVSVTGWRASLAIGEVGRCLLAWSDVDGPLAAEHGAPLRLVAPDHRGLEWVKWVGRIEVG